MYVHRNVDTCRGQKRPHWIPLGTEVACVCELPVFVSCPMWMLGAKLRSSAKEITVQPSLQSCELLFQNLIVKPER